MAELASGERDDSYIKTDLAMALLRQLRRSGVLNDGMMARVEADIASEIAYHEGSSSQADYVDMLTALAGFDEEALGVGTSEFRAAQKRRALRERNTRPVSIEGGNTD